MEEGMSRIKRPSPALVISIMALVAAVAVPAYAALTKGEKKTVKNLANAQITKRAPGLAVASAKNANSANNAANATTAGTANDALALGGRAASGYVRNDCNGFGQVKGFAQVIGTNSFSSSFVDVFGLTCSGEAAQARRISLGQYEVRFQGTTATVAMGSALAQSDSIQGTVDVQVMLEQDGPGQFEVSLV